MARGTVTVFDEFVLALGSGVHDLTSDVIKLGLITNAITPAQDDSSPTWADYVSAECLTALTGDAYPDNGFTLSGQTYEESDGVATFDDTGNISLAQNTAGFDDAYWGILYNDSKSDACIAYVDLAGPVKQTTGPITINWNAAGIFTISIS